jgi:hypothetical protein
VKRIIGFNNAATNRFHVKQENPVWCWAASIQIALNCLEINFTKQQIALAVHGRDKNGRIIEKPGKANEIDAFLSAQYLNPNSYHYKMTSLRYDGLPSPWILENVLKLRPVVMWKRGRNNSLGHVFVCTGITVDNSIITSFHVLDPSDIDLIEYTGGDLYNVVQHTWVITDVKVSQRPRPELRSVRGNRR